jgi:cell division protein FtsZ
MPGLINLDFADIRTVMGEMGKAMMGAGEAEGEGRSVKASESAISNPLLDDVSLRGARGVLINITGGNDMTLYEVDEAANRIREEVDPDANIIFGSTLDEGLQGKIRVSIFATGITGAERSPPIHVREEAPQYEPPLAASQAREEPVEEPAIALQDGEEPEEERAQLATEADPFAGDGQPQAEAAAGNEDLFETPEDIDEPEAGSETTDRRARLFAGAHEDTATHEDAGGQLAPEEEAAPIVQEVPPAESRRPAKRRRRRGSRLLGLLIDNSDDDDEYPRETAKKPESDGSRALPAGEAGSEPDKLNSAADALGEGEDESAEILEIPAFLRRQAN